MNAMLAPSMHESQRAHASAEATDLQTVCAALAALPVRLREATVSSRDAREGSVFLAYPGAARDGRDFIAEAVARGVSAVLYEAEGFAWNEGWRVPNLAVHGLKAMASAIGGYVYAAPSDTLRMIGVTGTNGKTSVSQWIAQALNADAEPAAVIGTIGNGMVGQLEAAENTTPDAIALQRLLRRYTDLGARTVAMEVSSHGLDQGRVADVKYDIAVFTNLTRDHLDYHGTMEAYGEAKARLFLARGLRSAVINVDDKFGRVLAARCAARGLDVIRTACNGGSSGADLVASELSVTSAGLSYQVIDRRSGDECRVESEILGAFNVANQLAVLGVLRACGITLSDAVARIARLQPVTGRMQTVRSSGRPLVVVDYAHTPDALEKVLSTTAAIVPERGRLIVVFGCGGNRDRGKRALMGAIAARLADLTVVTSDNPRHEDPATIIADIVPGVGDAPHRIVPERQQAIYEALNLAQANDIVVIAGKGHEDYQLIGGTKLHFSDVEIAQEALAVWGLAQRGAQ